MHLLILNDDVNATKNFVERLDNLIEQEPYLNGSVAGISVRSSTGEIIYDHLGDTRLRPASNMKLLTAAVALSILGPEHTFKTEILADGKNRWGILNGNLYIKGKGDPTLLPKDIDKLAENVKKSGVKIVTGNLIGDESWYDSIRYSKDLPWSDETAYYGAQISALSISPTKDYEAGTVLITSSPGMKIGEKALITIEPSSTYISIVNEAKTVGKNQQKKLEISREHGMNTIVISGTIPLHTKAKTEVIPVWEPTGYVLDLFMSALESKGIKVLGTSKKGVTPKNALSLAAHYSMPLSKTLIPFMKYSNNTFGEILVKEIGKARSGIGSWEKGIEVLLSELSRFDINTESLLIRDGSGISHVSGIPANEISKLLFEIQKEDWFIHYIAALPLSGHIDHLERGTLRNRLTNPSVKGKIRAKTGTLTTVSSLSGFMETASGKKLIFSIILNNLLDEDEGKKIEDKIVTLLATEYD